MGHRPVPGQLRRLLQDLPESRLRADLPAVDLLRLGVDPAGRLVRFVDLGVPLPPGGDPTRSAARRVGTECVSTCRSRCSPFLSSNHTSFLSSPSLSPFFFFFFFSLLFFFFF